ncbi:MAG TPA: methyltransferase domain-containing protein [Candidatus Polarisedimenticolaceae bacterium]|nr:methyltransferase domain-containing protein [Candidatus Polarisedimenticolaceae bacterium]
MSPTWRGLLARLGVAPPRPRLALHGYTPGRVEAPRLEALSDADLEMLNGLLPWKCFVVDRRGRRFGEAARAGKRDTPQPLPDPRIEALRDRFPLAGSEVLEIGCFEGVHTAALCPLAARVTAVDSRIENVVKTIVRCALLGHRPDVFVCDVDDPDDGTRLPEADVVHHVGVLYHLVDPVAHLKRVAAKTRGVLMLDTHVARPAEATATLVSGGIRYAVRRYGEFGRADVFSGMSGHSNWLTLDDLSRVLTEAGLTRIEVVETRDERNGLRVLLYAFGPRSLASIRGSGEAR